MSLREKQLIAERRVLCKLGNIYDSLEGDDRDVFDEWVESGKAAEWISSILTSDNHYVNGKTIMRHLRGQCCCPNDVAWRGAYGVA